jgi:hypothetical protein
MELTLAEMRVLSDALTFAIDTRMKEFDRNRDRCEVKSMQQAVQAARDIKRFDKIRSTIQLQINKEMRPCG